MFRQSVACLRGGAAGSKASSLPAFPVLLRRLSSSSSSSLRRTQQQPLRPASTLPRRPQPPALPLTSSSAARWSQQRRHIHPTRSGGPGPGRGPFQPLVPPNPASLGRPRPARSYKRSRKWGRRLLMLSAVLGAGYVADRRLYASGVTRSLRTFGTGLWVALDYTINFRAEPLPIIGSGGTIEDLHWRSAERLSELLRANGGLYLKMGQAIAMQSAILPPEFQRMFARMFDDAPSDSWKEVERVIRQDFGGRSPEEVFGVSFTGEEGKGVMERTARASASVAQVHWARLPDGREVAVKIQKPEIAKQIGWDLWAFKVVTKIYTWYFDLPLYSLVPFISERLALETDFINEAKNSDTMRKLIDNEPSLKGRVYIPIVYPELSSKRVLTTEWIEGVRLWDRDALTRPWYGGYGNASPGVNGKPLPPPDMAALHAEQRRNPDSSDLKPARDEWKGPRRTGGLGLSKKEVMTTIVDLFSAQIFKFGVVHCDPHPGNMFLRRLASGRAELVLIDHGLYVYMTPKFRREYAEFWKALMTFDNSAIARVCGEWGIKAADLFASATLMRPYEGGEDRDFRSRMIGADLPEGTTPAERRFEMQRRMKQGIRDMLADEDKWPRELVFIGRNMRIVQGNNQLMGSPVNRVKIMGEWASRSLFQDRGRPWRQRLANAWRHVIFKSVLAVTDVLFYFFKLRQWLGIGGGMEDVVEAQMKAMAQENFGVELQHKMFEG